VVSVLDSGAEGPGFKSQPRRCRVTILGKLFTPIVPLFTSSKIGSSPLKGCVGNWVTSVPCKVLESIIRDAVVTHLDQQNFYADCQHGFMKRRSTLTNLQVTLECWTSILEEGSGLDVIYLDYSAPPETVAEIEGTETG